MIKKKLLSIFCTFIVSTYLFTPVTMAKDYDIVDMPTTNKYYSVVQSVLDQKYMALNNVNNESYFLPSVSVKRKEFAMILANINGDMNALKNPATCSYTDVRKDNIYFRYIETEKLLIPGYGKSFKPDTYITKEDAAYAIVKAMGYDTEEATADGVQPESDIENLIKDTNTISHDLYKYVSIAINNGLIYADKDPKSNMFYFKAKQALTRLQLAILLDKAYQMGDYTKKLVSITPTPQPSPKSKASSKSQKETVKTQTKHITDFAITAKNDTSASFKWTGAKNASNMDIKQSTDNGKTWDSADIETLNSNNAKITSLKSNVKYEFKLIVMGGENSGESNIVICRTNNHKEDKPSTIKNNIVSNNGKVVVPNNIGNNNNSIESGNTVGNMMNDGSPTPTPTPAPTLTPSGVTGLSIDKSVISNYSQGLPIVTVRGRGINGNTTRIKLFAAGDTTFSNPICETCMDPRYPIVSNGITILDAGNTPSDNSSRDFTIQAFNNSVPGDYVIVAYYNGEKQGPIANLTIKAASTK